MVAETDIVLIYFEDAPLAFARIEEILPDHKPGWYHVRMLMLQLPVQTVTWILRDAYINGDPFTMDGKSVRLEKVVAPEAPPPQDDDRDADSTAAGQPGSKVISFTDLKKKR